VRANLAALPPAISATILVLEEHAAVQELIDQVLRASGHRVLSTRSALEAIEVVYRVRIDVLVVGRLERPKQTLVSEVRSIQPGLPIISICDLDDDLEDADPIRRLRSPLSLEDFCAAVVASLEHRVPEA
jgi:CheY-like chemotaxis protein